jgi:hypothetical protein
MTTGVSYRLPSGSAGAGRRRGGAASARATIGSGEAGFHNDVASTHMVADGGGVFMARLFEVTSRACVGAVLSQAMRPAVVERASIHSGAVRAGRVGGSGWGSDGQCGSVSGGMGAMISSGLSSKFVMPFLVGLGEVALEGSHGPGCFITFSPALDARSEDTSFFSNVLRVRRRHVVSLISASPQ